MQLPPLQKNQKRVVIIGAGFGGLRLARRLNPRLFQVVLIDRHNYHQFQPLLYQVASSGLEPSSISFPLRKIFHNQNHVVIRIGEVTLIRPADRFVELDTGTLSYDFLVMAQGATTHYFNLEGVSRYAFTMKSIPESLLLRNSILQLFEQLLCSKSATDAPILINLVVVGGGPTGVELSGALAEMKRKILPLDFPEIDFDDMHIYLLEASGRLLSGMTPASGEKALGYLKKLGVEVKLNAAVVRYDGNIVSLRDGQSIATPCLIWAAGVKGAFIAGLPDAAWGPTQRLYVDEYNRVMNLDNVFAIGDIAFMSGPAYPRGHPQVAQVAMQQADRLAKNLEKLLLQQTMKPFLYKDKGSMATVGRNLAVAELGTVRLKGFIAWFTWMAVHLLSIVGVKNRIFIFINWIWQYFTYDASLRLIIKPADKQESEPSTSPDQ
jgi:NADH dehydrogenase